jgi:hypothetical protein
MLVCAGEFPKIEWPCHQAVPQRPNLYGWLLERLKRSLQITAVPTGNFFDFVFHSFASLLALQEFAVTARAAMNACRTHPPFRRLEALLQALSAMIQFV